SATRQSATGQLSKAVKRMRASILFGFAQADLIMEGGFFSKDCQGPPDNIYLFETENTYNYIPWSPDLNETWPPYFKFHSAAYSVEQAGTVFVQLPGISCLVSIKYQESQPYWSGYSLFYSDGYGADAIPKAANGMQYCYLRSNDFNDSSILSGYKAIYFRPNDNACYDDYYKCTSGGDFVYYTNASCSGANDTIFLTTELTITESVYLGNISVQLYTIEGATVFFSWDAVVQYEDIVPYFDNAGDWITLIVVVITLVVGLYMIYKTVINIKKNKPSLSRLINLAAQLAGLTVSKWIFLGLGSLLDCILTSFLISDVFYIHKKVFARSILIPLLTIIHIGMFGSAYGGVYIVNVGPPTFSEDLIQLFMQWHKVSVIWMLFTFTFTTVVPILVALKIISLQVGKANNKFEINRVDPKLKYYIAGQISAFALYAVTFIIQQYTYLLGNDFASLNSNLYLTFGVAWHTFFTSNIYGIISTSSRYVKDRLMDGNNSNITK
ncbi:hypothetical protein HDV01_004591, partial [Terramyces sp. JEL0728]